ncbi:hypothetical protein T484DRAFT_1780659 [Baffinella frigidus]|nr:hypothetical protein T484DRAFT_1780659 [Cryptophyta sp. CCMP2293]
MKCRELVTPCVTFFYLLLVVAQILLYVLYFEFGGPGAPSSGIVDSPRYVCCQCALLLWTPSDEQFHRDSEFNPLHPWTFWLGVVPLCIQFIPVMMRIHFYLSGWDCGEFSDDVEMRRLESAASGDAVESGGASAARGIGVRDYAPRCSHHIDTMVLCCSSRNAGIVLWGFAILPQTMVAWVLFFQAARFNNGC